MRRILLLSILATSLTASTAVYAQSRDLGARGDLLDRVAVIVNDGIVAQSQIDQQVTAITHRLREQGTQLPASSVLRQQVTERLVLQELQMQRAQKVGLRIPDEALNAQLRDIANQNHIEFNKLPDALAQEGIVYAEYREEMRRDMTMQVLRQRDVLAHIYVSPREIDQFLARQAANKNADVSYNVSHILIALPEAATPAQLEQAERLSKDIRDRATKGEDFGQLAVTYSQAQTALERGALGWRKGNELPTFIAEMVGKLQPGEVSEPVRTPSGFHLIRLNEMRSDKDPLMVSQVHARHILIKTSELQDDETVRGRLQTIRDRIAAGTDDFGAIAKAVSEDPGSGSEGGDLGWTGAGTFVPEFEQALEKLPDGEISQPVRTQYGWHIIQMLGHRSQDMSTDERRRHAYEQIRASKLDEETELWLRRLRDEAYVDFRS